MSIARIANRFAEAIIDAVPTEMDRAEFFRDLEDVQTSIRNARELRQFFESPVIPGTRKLEAIDALFADRVGAYVRNVLRFLVEKEREAYVLQIIDAVFTLHREREGILTTRVRSAVALTDEQRANVRRALETVSGKRVETEFDVDAALVGGLTVRLGDTVYDGSVRHQLKRLHDRFLIGT
ncbi:MAG: ATP synthase F1 subunit delta [Bacteroidota bacterium]|jgi:F-type H+-transporting ATPase subunit delta|nr:ATP synthase F1 subunit delta [Bacteroidota bacterium]